MQYCHTATQTTDNICNNMQHNKNPIATYPFVSLHAELFNCWCILISDMQSFPPSSVQYVHQHQTRCGSGTEVNPYFEKYLVIKHLKLFI